MSITHEDIAHSAYEANRDLTRSKQEVSHRESSKPTLTRGKKTMKKLAMFAAALVVTVITLSAPKAVNAQMLYYINIKSTPTTQSNGGMFTCAVVKAPNGYGQLGRMTYSAQGVTLFSGETMLKSITDTSAVALFHTPVAGDYLAYTIVTINKYGDHASVTLVKVNRYRSVLWSTAFNIDNSATLEIFPIGALIPKL